MKSRAGARTRVRGRIRGRCSTHQATKLLL